MCKNCVSGNPAVLKFDSFESFMEQAKAPGSYSSSHERGQASFYGTDSFEEAVKVASRGWPEGTAKVLKMRASIDGVVRSLVNARSSTYSYDMSGEFVDVGRFLSGEPECFGIEIQDFGNMNKPVIKMVVNLSASGSVSSESLFMRGVAVVAAIDILEAVGNRVEVWAATGTSSGSKGQVLEVHALIKQANQPMNIDRLSFVIAHTAFFRRLMWAIQEQHNLHPNFTYPHAITSVKEGIVTDHSLTGTGLSKADLMRLIASICQKAGVEIPKAEIEALIKAGSALP